MIKILLVEDYAHNMRLLKQILLEVNESIETSEAVTGNEAIELAMNGVFDIVLLDIALPDRSGIDVVRELKGFPSYKNTIFIAITAYASSIDRNNIEADFDYYITKPVDEDYLVDLLNKLIKDRL